jgi:hypothetical protein
MRDGLRAPRLVPGLKGAAAGSDEAYVEGESSSTASAAAGPAVLVPAWGDTPANGGLPEPPEGAAIRVVRARHEACGHDTRVHLPGALPSRAVRRFVCQGCARPFEAPALEEVELRPPAPPKRSAPRRLPSLPKPPSLSAPEWLRDPRSRGWRYLSIPLAAVAVVAALMAIQGSDEPEIPFQASVPPSAAAGADAGPGAKAERQRPAGKGRSSADLIRESSFSLALPAGWKRSDPAAGATFAAATTAADADATLWVERDPDLDFPEFEARSLQQLRALAGNAQVVERVAAPTADATLVRLAADAPENSPAYEVTLRASGPYRYYLSTTVQPGASPEAVEGAELIHGSFLPSGGAAGGSGGNG